MQGQGPFAGLSPDLNNYLGTIWDELTLSAECLSRGWSLPVLATAAEQGLAQRIVVLRDVSRAERCLIAWTDLRSAKVAQLRRDSRTSWLFYDSQWRAQLTMSGTVTLHTDDLLAESSWERCRPESRVGYALPVGPGAVAAGPVTGADNELTTHPLLSGRESFCVLRGVVDKIDFFLIRRPWNLRCQWSWDGTEFNGTWLYA